MSPNTKPVKQEKSGWRDERLSKRHRLYGYNTPFQDIDWIEYDNCIPVALIEYKHERSTTADVTNCQMKTLANLGNMAGLPAFMVVYSDKFEFWVTPLNDLAQKIIPTPDTELTERRYVDFLYFIRGRKITDSEYDENMKREEEYMK